MSNEYTDEITIDLVDMVFFFLKKWRSLIAVVLIGALLGGAWAMLPNPILEEDEIEAPVLSNMEKALGFRELYRQQKEYNEESLLMNMDANRLYRGVITYHVSADKELNMVRAEYNALLNDDVNLLLKEASGYDVDLKYIDELTGNSASIVTDEKGDNSTSTLNVTYTVTCDDEEKCAVMLDVIREQVEQLQKELTRQYTDHSAVKVSDMVTQISDGWYIQNQDSKKAQQNDYLDAAMKLEDAFSDDEARYYSVVLLGVEEEAPGLGYYAKKIIVIAFLGGVLWAVWFLMKYLMDRNIKTVGEVLNVSGLFLLGRVKSEKNLKGIDKWLDALQEKTRPRLDESAYVASVIDSRKTGDAVLCGNRTAEEVCRIMGELAQSCAGLIPCDFTFQSSAALKKAKEVGQVILVARTGKTQKAELLREIELCKMQNVKILGVVIAD